MKKLISILMIMALVLSLAACGNKANNDTENPENAVTDVEKDNTDKAEENKPATDDKKEPEVTGDPTASNTSKPATKPADEQTHYPSQPVENKPAENKPAETPAENQPATPATLGGKLLAAFNANASSKSGEELANAILSIAEIQFSPVVMSVEEGLLTGFGNTEIKGFKSGTVFAPMIGTIPFVGYVFELENASDTASFVSTLKANANLRWNVCTEADEMITGTSGNKVFFVMCPKNFDEE